MLYAIGDLHLSTDSSKPMDIFGDEWVNHSQKLKDGFSSLRADDLTVICGDITWGMDMESCLNDFLFIDGLPGRKIILKGNHDFWWTTAAKTEKFFAANNISTISVLHNNCFFYGETAICGTKGYFFQSGKPSSAHDVKIMKRECQRLETSLRAAGGAREKICFLHYPPIFGNFHAGEMIDIMHRHGVKMCFYGHLHGAEARLKAFEGIADGINYRLCSADNVRFKPIAAAPM